MQAKLAELQMFVKSNITAAATSQKDAYDTNSTTRDFQVDNPVWLSIPTSCKLNPKWEGGWKIKAIKSPVNMEITDGQRNKVVHVNRLQHRIQRLCKEIPDIEPAIDSHIWEPPWAEHITQATATAPSTRHYPLRERRPPDRLEYHN